MPNLELEDHVSLIHDHGARPSESWPIKTIFGFHSSARAYCRHLLLDPAELIALLPASLA